MIFSSSPCAITAAPSDLQVVVQWRVLDVLAQQIVVSGTASSTNIDLRRFGVEAPHEIFRASGHTLLVDGSVFRPGPSESDAASYLVPPESSTSRGRPPALGYPQENGYYVLVKTVLQCMTLMCDGLAAHSRAPEAPHRHAWAVRGASGHEYRADGG